MPEELIGGDIEEFIVLSPGGLVPGHVHSPRYRFREEVGPRALRMKITEAKLLAEATARPSDGAITAAPFAQLWDGQVVALDDLWKGGGMVPPPRRLRGEQDQLGGGDAEEVLGTATPPPDDREAGGAVPL
eukprot:6774488-Pyramimonas_sp.AAC.1